MHAFLGNLINSVKQEKTVPASFDAYNHGIARQMKALVKKEDWGELKIFAEEVDRETSTFSAAILENTPLAMGATGQQSSGAKGT